MVGSITPSDEKLMSKGIKSIRQRINLLKDYISLDIDEFKEYVKKNLCDKEIVLTEEDVEKSKKLKRISFNRVHLRQQPQIYCY